MKSGIYWIRNKTNNKIYVGSSTDTRLRFNNHRSSLRRNIHVNPHLQRAWNMYGEDSFEIKLILPCNPELILFYEQQFLDQWKPEYNINVLAHKPNPRQYTQEERDKVSREHKGKIVSEETREKFRQRQLGKKFSEETKKKMGEKHRGNNRSAKHYNGIIDPNGKIYNNIFNLSKFCREQNLEVRNLSAVIHGKIKTHRGWSYKEGVT
jgi:group I intron endonuclease